MKEIIKPIDFDKKIIEFCSYYEENRAFLISASEVFRTLITALLVDTLPIDSIISRVKHRDECISKFKRKYLAEVESRGEDFQIQDFISDMIGVRVICLYLEDIDKIKVLMEDNFKEIEITDKSLLLNNTEDKFGYKSLHLDLMLNTTRIELPEYKKFKELKFELQIRTIIQDAWSVLDHKIKYKKNISVELKRKINRLSAQFEMADEEFLRIKDETFNEEAKAKTEIAATSEHLKGILDVFQFITLSQKHFPDYYFHDYKADGFVDELLKIDADFSADSLSSALKNYQAEIEKFSSDTLAKMNPYTIIRHCIYLADKSKHEHILYEAQRLAYERWKEQS